jgi:hypothetical protein
MDGWVSSPNGKRVRAAPHRERRIHHAGWATDAMDRSEVFLLIALALSFGDVPLYFALRAPFDHK